MLSEDTNGNSLTIKRKKQVFKIPLVTACNLSCVREQTAISITYV